MAGRQSYQFGEFLLDDGERRVSRPMQLAPKTYEVLVALLRRAGGLVMKQEWHAQVWPEARVEEGILAVHLSALRRALDGQDNTPYIETVSRSAYRFTVPVIERNSAELPTAEIAELCKRGHAHLRAASMYEVPKALAAFRAAIALDPTDAPHMPGWACLLCTGTVSNAAILRRLCRGEGLRAPGFGYRSRLVRNSTRSGRHPFSGLSVGCGTR